MGAVEFRVLGPLETAREGVTVTLGGPKPRQLLAFLLLQAGRPVGVDALTDALWGEHPPATAVKTIHKYVSVLRKGLGDGTAIATQPTGYTCEVSPGQLDADRFEYLVDQASRTIEPERSAAMLEEALGLWRGVPWADLSDHAEALAERARLEELRLSAIEDLMEAELSLGRHDQITARLEKLVTESSLRERRWAQLMTALYRSGRQAEALAAYQRLRQAVIDEFGIEPSPELQDLQHRILTQDPRLAVPKVPVAASGSGRELEHLNNLPVPLTRFVGRRRELAETRRLLGTSRLLTLTGVGGCGKTRLALELVVGELNRHPDGVWLVALDALADPDRVPRAVATAIGAREQPATSLTDVVVDVLRPKQSLLILDNCEHLIEACARFAHRLLSACPDLRILATSRERLGITGESVWQVPPMPIPQSEKLPSASLRRNEAIELFVDRATSAAPGFELNDDNASAVAQICRRLDGIPLVLELAASRVASLEPNDIARRLDDRLDVLGEGNRSAPPRQQTLAAAIDWSHQLLEVTERQLFNRLSVFAGGFTLEAAEDVCCDPTIPADQVVGLLSRLVESSLVLPPHHARGPARYRLLETLRHFGRERLYEIGETERLRQRHVRYCLSLAEKAEPELRGPNQAEWLDRLEAEHHNLRAALEYSRDDAEVGLRLVSTLWDFWEARGHVGEGLEWLERLLTGDSPVEDRVRARATLVVGWLALAHAETDRAAKLCDEVMSLYGSLSDRSGIALSTHLRGWLTQYRGAYGEASKLLEEALAEHERLDESWQTAFALHHLGMVSRLRGDYEQARRQHQRSLDLYRRAGDRLRQAYALWMLGTVARYQGEYASSSIHLEESLRLLGELGDRSGVAHVQYTLGDVARLREDHAEAVSLYEESLARLRELGDKRCVASTLGNLAAVAQLQSDPDRTESLFFESLGLRRELGDKAGIAECLEGLATVNISRHEPAHAAQLLGAAQALRDVTGSVRPEVERAAHDRQVAALRDALRDEIFETSWTMGLQDPERIIVLASKQRREMES